MSRGVRVAPTVAFVLVTIMVIAVVAQMPTTLAAWTDTTGNGGNELHTATVDPVSGLTAKCESRHQVDLSWTPSPTSAVTGYRIDRRRDDENVYTHLATVTPRTTSFHSDTDSPFPSSLIELGADLMVEYRIQAEIAGTNWRSAHQEASASGSVAILNLSFSCD